MTENISLFAVVNHMQGHCEGAHDAVKFAFGQFLDMLVRILTLDCAAACVLIIVEGVSSIIVPIQPLPAGVVRSIFISARWRQRVRRRGQQPCL